MDPAQVAGARPIDALVWSSLWLAAAIGALTAAAGLALSVPIDPLVVALAACGTVVVYVVDHLRDLERDAADAPLRSAFVARHFRALIALASCCGLASGVLAHFVAPRVILVAAGVLALGLLHRRLKRFALTKPLYVALAGTAVTVGFPLAAAPDARHGGWVAGIYLALLGANVLLYNLRPDKPLVTRVGADPVRVGVAVLLLAAAGLALAGPTPVRALVGLPVAVLPSLLWFRPGERFAAWVVDGTLLLGALLVIVCSTP